MLETYAAQDAIYRFPDDWKERWPNLAKTQDDVPISAIAEEKLIHLLIGFQRFQGALVRRRPLEQAVFVLVVAVPDVAGLGKVRGGPQLCQIVGADAQAHQAAAHIAGVLLQEGAGNFRQLRGGVRVLDLQATA